MAKTLGTYHCVIGPDSKPVVGTLTQDGEYAAIARFTAIRNAHWPNAKRDGYRIAEIELIEKGVK